MMMTLLLLVFPRLAREGIWCWSAVGEEVDGQRVSEIVLW